MNKLLLAVLGSMLITFPAIAYGFATLRSCDIKVARGRTVYVGTYEYRGQLVRYVFDDFCPPMIEVDELY